MATDAYLDLSAPELLIGPYRTYARLRANRGVHSRSGASDRGFPVLSRYADVRLALGDRRVGRTGPSHPLRAGSAATASAACSASARSNRTELLAKIGKWCAGHRAQPCNLRLLLCTRSAAWRTLRPGATYRRFRGARRRPRRQSESGDDHLHQHRAAAVRAAAHQRRYGRRLGGASARDAVRAKALPRRVTPGCALFGRWFGRKLGGAVHARSCCAPPTWNGCSVVEHALNRHRVVCLDWPVRHTQHQRLPLARLVAADSGVSLTAASARSAAAVASVWP